MNRSYSKIRHIQESNQRLEKRLLGEQQAVDLITESEEQEAFPSKSFAYHVTPDIYIEQIKREGLTPKSESKITAHPERIYLYLNPNSSYKTLASDLLHSSKYKDQVKNYFVLEIDLTKLPEHKFYSDSDSSMMYVPIYTKQSIPPSAIKVIQTIPVGELPISTLSSPDDDKESKEFFAKFNDDYEKEKSKNSVNKWDEIRKKLDAMGGTHMITLNKKYEQKL